MKSAPVFRLLLTGLTRENVAGIACPPALQTLLRVARPEASFAGGYASWLCHLFGAVAVTDVPVGPYAASGDGLPAENGYWLCASPVQLQLQRDSFAMDGLALGLSQSDTDALVEALNTHFSADGMTFHAPRPQAWYVQLDAVPDLRTTPLSQVLGRDIHPCLPRGADALLWHRRLNEIQMLLHQHPVNEARELAGLPPVNSLWFWGGGQLHPLATRPAMRVWAGDALASGLARASGIAVAPLPESARDLLDAAMPEEGMAVLHAFPARDTSNASACEARWADIDRQWIAPLLDALRAGNMARLELWVAGATSVRGYSLQRSSLYKFWRRSRPLENYLG